MSIKSKFVIGLVILATVSLFVGIWALAAAPLAPPPSPPTGNNSPHIDPHWTFPTIDPINHAPDGPDYAPLIAGMRPSVVSVITEVSVSSGLFGRRIRDAAGSGIVIDADGYIVTNNHVIEDALSITVELHDGRAFAADLVGGDPTCDLAVIKIDASDLSPALWGDSGSLAVGNVVLAMGNALGGGIVATKGIVSRLDVTLSVEGVALFGLIQTDAAINPGNSGGPLVNMAGEVVGINSVKIVAPQVEGVGFAISSDQARLIIPDLIRHGRAVCPWLGVGLVTVDRRLAADEDLPVERGALIVEVVSDSPADIAGLRAGDIIISFAEQEIHDVPELVQAIRTSNVGDEVEIVFVRNEETRVTSAQLIERPDP